MLSTAILITASMMVGQDESAAAHMKPFAPFIGQWVFQGTVKEQVPLPKDGKPVEAGTKLVAHNSFRWAVRRNAVLFDWIVRFEGVKPIESTQLLVWDKDDKVIRCLWQTTAGEQGTTDWKFSGDALVGSVRGVNDNGTESSSKVHFRMKGKDAYVWKITDREVGGERLPDSAEYEYVRIR